jgi:hypothetical protein
VIFKELQGASLFVSAAVYFVLLSITHTSSSSYCFHFQKIILWKKKRPPGHAAITPVLAAIMLV